MNDRKHIDPLPSPRTRRTTRTPAMEPVFVGTLDNRAWSYDDQRAAAVVPAAPAPTYAIPAEPEWVRNLAPAARRILEG